MQATPAPEGGLPGGAGSRERRREQRGGSRVAKLPQECRRPGGRGRVQEAGTAEHHGEVSRDSARTGIFGGGKGEGKGQGSLEES